MDFSNTKLICALLACCVLCSCQKFKEIPPPEEEPKRLLLSVDDNITISGVDCEFDILEGNGGYTYTHDNESSKVTLVGSKVIVNMLQINDLITIIDQKGEEASVWITSESKSLISSTYGIYIDFAGEEQITMHEVNFGAGGYRTERIKGNSANATVNAKDQIVITSIKEGNSYFNIFDKRGSKAPLTVFIGRLYEMTTDRIEVTAVNDQTLSIILNYGGRNWRLSDKAFTSPLIENLYFTKGKKYDILQIDTTTDTVKGTAIIVLEDDAGNNATVTLTIK